MSNPPLVLFYKAIPHPNLGVFVGRMERVTREIKNHDYKLFCARNAEGKLCVYRKGSRTESYHLGDGNVLHFIRPAPFFVCALTHNWQENGEPVEWGLEPIMARLRAMDLWHRDIVSDLEEASRNQDLSTERARKNHSEDFLYEWHGKFKKTFSDVNTAGMKEKRKNFKSKEEL